MIKDLELLLKLQEMDDDIGELERSKVYLPEMIGRIEGDIDDAERAVKDNEERLTAAKMAQKRLEVEIESARQQIEKLNDQMSAVKTNREYDALSREIQHVKDTSSVGEDQLLATLEEIERRSAERPELVKRRDQLAAGSAAQLEGLQAQMKALEGKIGERTSERNAVAKKVDRKWLSTYDRIRRRFPSVVVPLKKRACAGCFTAIPPQTVQILKRADRLVTCESCGRILYWDADLDT